MPSLAFVGIFARDSELMLNFYSEVFSFPEIEYLRSPVFRVLDTGRTPLGFYAKEAYARLDLAQPAHGDNNGARFLLTIEVNDSDEADRRIVVALAKGATLVKPAEATHYGWYMAVLQDPEGNAFRIGAPLK